MVICQSRMCVRESTCKHLMVTNRGDLWLWACTVHVYPGIVLPTKTSIEMSKDGCTSLGYLLCSCVLHNIGYMWNIGIPC